MSKTEAEPKERVALPVEALEVPEPVNLSEQTERQIAIGWAAAGLITEAERDKRLADIRRRYRGGR